jgi:hypothetical protein
LVQRLLGAGAEYSASSVNPSYVSAFIRDDLARSTESRPSKE